MVKGQGKGSHTKLRKGNNTQIIPKSKSLSTGIEKALLKEIE
ncbi:MAG: hypothetical protein OCD02_03815 [Spirochaetaceae bacterium]